VAIPETTLLEIAAGLLLVGLGLAAVLDVRTREVPDSLWIGMGVAGSVLGGVAVAPGGWVPIALWVVAAAFVLEHLFPWDTWLKGDERADWVEVAIYLGVLAVVGVAVLRLGFGPGQVPVSVVLVVVSVLFARGLFEGGILYGGADAKAVMVAGLMVPLFPTPVFSVPAAIRPVTSVLPFALDLLLDAALVSVVVPIALGVLNVARGEFHLRGGFTTYSIPVEELPNRWVWLRDPAYPVDREAEEAIETSEEDRQWRAKLAAELTRRGVTRVRVGPQLPFVVFLFLGALLAIALGNVILDVLVAL
jgi:hypothetical protein